MGYKALRMNNFEFDLSKYLKVTSNGTLRLHIIMHSNYFVI